MNEASSEVTQTSQTAEKKKLEITQAKKPEQKLFFQEIWGRFKEGLGKLWKKAGETFESVDKKAEEISKKISVENVKTYFKTQSENFRDEIEIRSNDVNAGMYDFLAFTNEVREKFWNKFLGGKLSPWGAENREKAKERRDYAKLIRARNEELKEKARKKREEAKSLDKAAANIKGSGAAA